MKTAVKSKKSTGTRKQELNEDKYQIQSWKDFKPAHLKNVIRYNPYAWMLLALIAIGAVLRFVNLGFNSLWLDEGATVEFAQNSFVEIWQLTTYGGDINAPLFYWLEHIMLAFGSSEVILRFLPALFGCLTIPVIYFIGKEIKGSLCGIISAGIITFSTFHLYYSQEARAYSTVLLFISLALLFYLLAINSEGLKYWIIAGIFASLAFWTHPYTLIAIGILVLHALIIKWKDIRNSVKTLLPILSMVLSFVIVSLPQIIIDVGKFFERTASEPTWGYRGFDLIYSTLYTCSNSEMYLMVIFILLAIIGTIYLLVKPELRKYGLLILLSLVLTFVISFILSYKMPFNPRYIIFILPFFVTAIAAAFTALPKEIGYKKVAVVVLVLCCLVSIPYYTAYYTSYSKEDWRGTASLITDWTNDGDYVVAVPNYMNIPFDYYYDSVSDNTIERGVSSVNDIEKINQERGSSDVYYYMTWDISAVDTSGAVVKWLSDNTQYLGQNVGIHLFKSSA